MRLRQDQRDRLAKRYATFAEFEAGGVAAPYEALADLIAQTDEALAFLAELPEEKQQPNLFLAALRYSGDLPGTQSELCRIIRDKSEGLKTLMLSRSTQTNEPARCAVILPLLAQLPQPLAIIEVGAAAGLCLLPDYYAYDYGAAQLAPAKTVGVPPPLFRCRVNGAAPLPGAMPHIAWRAGLEVNPIDLNAPADCAWLQNLVWPGQDERLHRLQSAIEIAKQVRPVLRTGDLRSDLVGLIEAAPPDATLVVFHTAVLSYVRDPRDRQNFADTMQRSRAVWISNESAHVFFADTPLARSEKAKRNFLLSMNGGPVAWTAPHGQSLDWFGARPKID